MRASVQAEELGSGEGRSIDEGVGLPVGLERGDGPVRGALQHIPLIHDEELVVDHPGGPDGDDADSGGGQPRHPGGLGHRVGLDAPQLRVEVDRDGHAALGGVHQVTEQPGDRMACVVGCLDDVQRQDDRGGGLVNKLDAIGS